MSIYLEFLGNTGIFCFLVSSMVFVITNELFRETFAHNIDKPNEIKIRVSLIDGESDITIEDEGNDRLKTNTALQDEGRGD